MYTIFVITFISHSSIILLLLRGKLRTIRGMYVVADKDILVVIGQNRQTEVLEEEHIYNVHEPHR